MGIYFKTLKNFHNFGGRASRKEFNIFFFCYVLVLGMSYILGQTLPFIAGPFIVAYQMFSLVSLVAITVRRGQDIEDPGVWILFGIVPILCFVTLLGLMLKDSEHCTNQYGIDPTNRSKTVNICLIQDPIQGPVHITTNHKYDFDIS